MASRAQGREVMRGGVKGHMITVAPKEGYEKFVPAKYRKPLAR